MKQVVLATCADWPEPVTDAPLRDALSRRGLAVASVPWDAPMDAFASASAVVLRACWDYHGKAPAFSAWLDGLSKVSGVVLNPPDYLRWNLDKRYLLDLIGEGVSVVPTEVCPSTAEDSQSVAARFGWHDAVVKPVFGQSGHGVQRLNTLPRGAVGPLPGVVSDFVLVQPFQSDIDVIGEALLVFFDGEFSHGLRRVIPKGEWRANSQYGTRRERFAPSDEVVEQARAVIRAASNLAGASAPPAYARVDGLIRDDALTLMELELIEPALGFELVPERAERFADVIESALE